MSLTRTQGDALCATVRAFRADWDVPGIRAAVKAASDAGMPAVDILRRSAAVVANPSLKTPALIGRAGAIAGEHDIPPVTTGPPRVLTCAEHTAPEPCSECRATLVGYARSGVDLHAVARVAKANAPRPRDPEAESARRAEYAEASTRGAS